MPIAFLLHIYFCFIFQVVHESSKEGMIKKYFICITNLVYDDDF